MRLEKNRLQGIRDTANKIFLLAEFSHLIHPFVWWACHLFQLRSCSPGLNIQIILRYITINLAICTQIFPHYLNFEIQKAAMARNIYLFTVLFVGFFWFTVFLCYQWWFLINPCLSYITKLIHRLFIITDLSKTLPCFSFPPFALCSVNI